MAGAPDEGTPARRRRVIDDPLLTPAQVQQIAMECAKILAAEERLMSAPPRHITINSVSNMTVVFSSEAQMSQFNNEFKEKVTNVAQGNQGAIAQGTRAQAVNLGNLSQASTSDQEKYLALLGPELAELLGELEKDQKPDDPDHVIDVMAIGKATEAAKAGDGSKVLGYLKRTGNWAWETATKIGASIAAEAIMQATGMKPHQKP